MTFLRNDAGAGVGLIAVLRCGTTSSVLLLWEFRADSGGKPLLPPVLYVFSESLPVSSPDLGQWDRISVFVMTHKTVLLLKAKEQKAGFTSLLISGLMSHFMCV